MRKSIVRRSFATLALAAVVSSASSTAFAAITESEPNATLAQANLIQRGGTVPFSDVGVLSLSELVGNDAKGDVDVFSITLNAGEVLTAVTTPLSGAFASPDTELSIISSAGVILAADDDSGSGPFPADPNDSTNLGSLVQFLATSSGTYYLAVTGSPDGGTTLEGDTFGDGNHIGAHEESGPYALTLSVVQVPEPATLGLALPAIAWTLRRRRNA